MTTTLTTSLTPPAATARSHFVHVPTPGDHYSPATGSAVMTVIHGMSKPHLHAGGHATILVSRGTTNGYPPYSVGETREIDLPTTLPSRGQKLFDVALGRIALRRPSTARMYHAVVNTLTPGFDGTIIVHNAPAAIPYLKTFLPHSLIVLYAHNQLFNTYGPREIRHIAKCAHRIIAVSDFIARDIQTRAGTALSNVKTVLNGVDTNLFTPSTPPPGPPIILFLGRIVPEKGPDVLLKAAAKISHIPFRLHLVGSSNFNAHDALTPYERHLRELAAPLKDRVIFSPFVPREQVPAQYHQASIFVAPSTFPEPFGLTIAEALASGLPCILSQTGGIPEVAADTALYFSVGDADTLAKKLQNLLENQTLRAELAFKSRQRALQIDWCPSYQRLCKALA